MAARCVGTLMIKYSPKKKNVWHATLMPYWWDPVFRNDVSVHCGTFEAARSRAVEVSYQLEHTGAVWGLYELVVRPHTYFHPEVLVDWKQSDEPPTFRGDAVKYKNEVEDVGSTSMLIHARCLRIAAAYQLSINFLPALPEKYSYSWNRKRVGLNDPLIVPTSCRESLAVEWHHYPVPFDPEPVQFRTLMTRPN